MKLNELKPPRGAVKRRKRRGIGTGSGHGGTSTRGNKGQYSRSGGKIPAWFEGGQMPLQRRLPKRGFFNLFRVEYAVVNLDDLAARFAAGAVVTPEVLRAERLVTTKQPIKVLARGEIAVALTVKAHKFSGKAAEKIAAAGGSVETLQ